MASFDIDSFASNVSKQGVLIPNRYVLEIVSPPAGVAEVDAIRQLAFRVNTVELPGKSLSTTEVKYYGPFRKSPYAMTYEDLNFTVMLSDDARERNFFSNWMDMIYDYNTGKVEYYENFVTDLKFLSYDPIGEEVFTVSLMEAFPIQVGQIAYSYSAEEPATCQITFAYRKWSNEFHTRNGARPATLNPSQAKGVNSANVFTASTNGTVYQDFMQEQDRMSTLSAIPNEVQQRAQEMQNMVAQTKTAKRNIQSTLGNWSRFTS
jgi:hypothetical protein|tara:strand:- start:2909 stop:3697 length:789 start_codon:yes stop_codon:yes gene_type:complete